MTILVTGYKSYIASGLMAKLYAAYPNEKILVCDAKDGHDYRRLKDFEFDVVIHLGAISTIMGSLERADELLDVNAFGLIGFFKNNKVDRFVFPSTGGAIYGERVVPAKEDEAIWNGCLNPYSQSKYIAEKIIREFCPHHTILRLGNVFGGDMDSRTEPLVLTHFRYDNPITLFGGEQTRDFVSLEIVCDAMLKAIELKIDGTFNIGNGIPVPLRDLAKEFSQKRGVPLLYAPARNVEAVKVFLDVTKAREAGLIPQEAPINDYSA